MDDVVSEAIRIAERARKAAITRELTDLINDLYDRNVKVAQIIEARHADQRKIYIVVLRHGDAVLISYFMRHKDGCFVSMDLECIAEVDLAVVVSLDAIAILPVQEMPAALPVMEVDAPQIVNLDGTPYHLNVFGAFWRWLSGRGL